MATELPLIIHSFFGTNLTVNLLENNFGIRSIGDNFKFFPKLEMV